jgi:hypothetical protein
MLLWLLVGDPVGMLFCNHVKEVDQTAAELCGRLRKPQAQSPARLDRLVVSAVTDVATPRAEIPEPQTGSVKAALLRGCHTSVRGFEVAATLRVGADVPNRDVAVILAPTRVGSTV